MTSDVNISNSYDDYSDVLSLEELQNTSYATEIDFVDTKGVIKDSTDPSVIGKNITELETSESFAQMLSDPDKFYISEKTTDPDNEKQILSLHNGISVNKGILRIIYDADALNSMYGTAVLDISQNRHVGNTGGYIIVMKNNQNIVCRTENTFFDADDFSPEDLALGSGSGEDYQLYIGSKGSGDFYYMFRSYQGMRIYVLLSKDEADYSKVLSLYLNFFLVTIIFGALFTAIYLVIKKMIVKDIRTVNDDLAAITAGDLDTVVNVRDSAEFNALSDGINATVDSMKGLIKEANERIDQELQVARDIQAQSLPSTFPAFPDHDEFDIYALMDPAKEVGGDFYDFYMLDDHRLAFAIADVSGKGIPAALFMMKAKTSLKSYAENNIAVADVFINANYTLCTGNDADMFVTCWMGYLDLNTGELKYANAGHNHPLIRRKNGQFEFVKEKAGFILAGMETMVFKEQSLVLEPGDELFLYTDGVPEATNVDNELYGNDRLQNCLNAHIGDSCHDVCLAVKKDVDTFYEGAPQFDDITEMSIQFFKYRK